MLAEHNAAQVFVWLIKGDEQKTQAQSEVSLRGFSAYASDYKVIKLTLLSFSIVFFDLKSSCYEAG